MWSLFQGFSDLSIRKHVVGMRFSSLFQLISFTLQIIALAIVLNPLLLQFTIFIIPFHRTDFKPFTNHFYQPDFRSFTTSVICLKRRFLLDVKSLFSSYKLDRLCKTSTKCYASQNSKY